MPTIARDEFDIYYEITRENDGPTLLLVAGLGEQIGSVEYPEEQCDTFAARGFQVVRMDNRTMGLSQLRNGSEIPAFTRLDLATDIAAVIHDLAVGPVHLVGASMGSALVRWTAVHHPDRVATLTAVMGGASGAPDDESSPQIPESARGWLVGLTERRDRAAAIDATVAMWRWAWGEGYPFEEEWVRGRVAAAFDRSYHPEGIATLLRSAGGGAPFLRDEQTRITCPTLVMHGGSDPCFPEEHGEDIAARIPGAELWFDPRMGHIMHREQWEEMADRVAALAARVDGVS